MTYMMEPRNAQGAIAAWSTSVQGTYARQRLVNGAIHDWYRFVLAYPDHYVREQLESFKLAPGSLVLDPFMGTGTTLVESRKEGYPSVGIEANPFCVFASRIKTTWDLDAALLERAIPRVVERAIELAGTKGAHQQTLSSPRLGKKKKTLAAKVSPLKVEIPELLGEKYISELPLRKCLALKESIKAVRHAETRNFLRLALASTFVAAANVKFGPEIGYIAPKEDAPVFEVFQEKASGMARDLRSVADKKWPPAKVIQGDARHPEKTDLEPGSVSAVITSPPYPVDKDYTRITRLELVILDFATNLADVRKIKENMVRASTRQIYRGDKEVEKVLRFPEVSTVIDEIVARTKRDGDSSGFAKMYPRLVGEYFGGMYEHLANLRPYLAKDARLAYVVGDSRSFKMVHIETAKTLGVLAADLGYRVDGIDRWRNRVSTAHKESLDENVLLLRAPN